jgi:hypothetical protein
VLLSCTTYVQLSKKKDKKIQGQADLFLGKEFKATAAIRRTIGSRTLMILLRSDTSVAAAVVLTCTVGATCSTGTDSPPCGWSACGVAHD